MSRSLFVEKAKISLPLLISELFHDLTPEKTVTISSQSKRRERDLQELFRCAKKPVALVIADAHNLHPKTIPGPDPLLSGSLNRWMSGRPEW